MFSAVQAWEITVKYSIGRLSLGERPLEFVQEQLRTAGFQVLPIRLEHSLEVAELPVVHGDPFDRLLVAQCRCDGLTLIGRDSHLQKYPIRALWQQQRSADTCTRSQAPGARLSRRVAREDRSRQRYPRAYRPQIEGRPLHSHAAERTEQVGPRAVNSLLAARLRPARPRAASP